MIILGIDVGVTGAVAVCQGQSLVKLMDLPTKENGHGKVKRKIDGRQLAVDLFHALDKKESVIKAYMEHQRGMPDQGSATVFSLGHSFGVIEGVLAAMNIPVVLIDPRRWKDYYGLSNPNLDHRQKKRGALLLARKHFPGAELHLHKHHNRAEALLIALYGRHLAVHGGK